ncbi:hypothetical protein [Cohnella sp. WQ 127256]|uniref:hypothetical protein n=1 Tax=Cohnella sp. WQ 127256 TaxID=2938790 RepID=UPI0021182F2B|nr:hypothetical protein [Cohnella sp. WQ 127256]
MNSFILFLRSKRFIIPALSLILLIGIFVLVRIYQHDQLKKEMMDIEINEIHLFMNREEVGKLYGLGIDKTIGCFGCEMNFIYPKLKLFGRYSETFGRMNGKEINDYKSPQVKMITTADPTSNVMGIRIGHSFDDATRILESKGFHKVGTSFEYVKRDYYIHLWNDGNINYYVKNRMEAPSGEDNIGSITIGYRVEKDEEIQY